jgi:hypothetical protein
VVQVDGDARGRFFAAADVLGVAQRHVQDLNYGSCKAIRSREGSHWGNMTSGGLRQALWAVLRIVATVVTFFLDDPRGSPGRFNLGGRRLIRPFDRPWIMLWWGSGAANLLGAGATQTVRSCLTVGCKPKLLASSDW